MILSVCLSISLSTTAHVLLVVYPSCWCVSSNFFISSADAHGCKIYVNTDKALAKPWYNNQLARTVYSCTPENSSTEYEVHVLSVYKVVNSSPPTAGDATVNIVGRGSSDRPIVLVLGSYEPVHWILNLPTDLIISIVIMVSSK